MCDQTFLLSNMAPQVEDLPLELSSSSLSGGEGVQQGQMGTPGAVCTEAHQTLQVVVVSFSLIAMADLITVKPVSKGCEIGQECLCLHWASLLTTHGGRRKDVCKIPGR